jgi:Branched-chain amino acid ABC-type transport system, permease components
MYGIIGLGFSLIYKASGLVTFCQGEFMMLGAFVGLTLYRDLHVPLPLTILLTTVIIFVLGMITERYLIATLVERGAGLAYIMLSTIAISMLFQNSAQLIWTTSVENFPPLFKVATIKIGSVNIVPEALVVLVVALISMVGLHLFMNKTKYGTSMRAASLDPKAASAVGINVPVTKGVTWGIAAALAGAIGCVIGPIMSVYATMGAVVGIKGFSGATAGGYGNMYGAIIGGMFFGFLESFISGYLSSIYRDLISFSVLIIIMIFMPTGIFKADVTEH